MNTQATRWQTGETIELEVMRVTSFGTYLGDGNAAVLMLATRERWPTERDPRPVVGQRLLVRITGYSENDRIHLGSLRAVNQAANPYRQFSIGQALFARVTHVGAESASVEVATDVTATLGWSAARTPPQPGETVWARVTLLDLDAGRLELVCD